METYRFWTFLGLAMAGSPAVIAQQDLYEIQGFGEKGGLGHAVASVGDLDQDGIGEIGFGAPFDDLGGRVELRSGKDGKLLHLLLAAGPCDQFGIDLDGAGDVDQDGIPDIVIGTYTSPGYARVYSGATGAVLHHVQGETWFGAAVAGAGDVDQDGHADFLVGSPGAGFGVGAARLYSGQSGGVLRTFQGSAPFGLFGHALDGGADVDQDGFPDVVIGAPGEDAAGPDAGVARVYSAQSGALLHEITGAHPFHVLGEAVAFGGDLDADGHQDLVVGAPHDLAPPGGSARLVSGKDGAVLATLKGGGIADRFGIAVDGAGDVDGDGHADVVVGASWDATFGPKSGRATVFSGRNQQPLAVVLGNGANAELGRSVAGAGDLDRDGHPDVILGSPGSGQSPGTVSAISLGKDFVAVYGEGCAGLFGLAPKLAVQGKPFPGAELLWTVEHATAGAPGLLLVGTEPAHISVTPDACPFLVSFPFALMVPLQITGPPGVPGEGLFQGTAFVPAGAAGVELFAQVVIVYETSAMGIAGSNGVRVGFP